MTSVYDNIVIFTKKSLTDVAVKGYNYDINGNRKSLRPANYMKFCVKAIFYGQG